MTERGGIEPVDEEHVAGGGGVDEVSRAATGDAESGRAGSGGGADEPVEGRVDVSDRGADRPSEAG